MKLNKHEKIYLNKAVALNEYDLFVENIKNLTIKN